MACTGDTMSMTRGAPTFPVVAYYSRDGLQLTIIGETLFDALRREVELLYRDCLDNLAHDPEYKDSARRRLDHLARVRERVQTYATGDQGEVGAEYLAKYRGMSGNSRNRRVSAPTRDGMGIVVPKGRYQPL